MKSPATFPSALDMMSERIDWTQKLGDALVRQHKTVMDTLQKLRTAAKLASPLTDAQAKGYCRHARGAHLSRQARLEWGKVVHRESERRDS